MVLLDAALDIAGIFAKVGKEGAYKDSREWCFFHADRSLPYASAAALKMPVESNYKKQRGVLSKLNASVSNPGSIHLYILLSMNITILGDRIAPRREITVKDVLQATVASLK